MIVLLLLQTGNYYSILNQPAHTNVVSYVLPAVVASTFAKATVDKQLSGWVFCLIELCATAGLCLPL